jgi:predicted lipoprotein
VKHIVLWLVATACLTATALRADMVDEILDDQILPGMMTLSEMSQDLALTSQSACQATDENLQNAFGAAFDAWIQVSHLRFGPTEAENRAFALSFWPDSRGKIPKTLGAVLRKQDTATLSAEEFAKTSIAGRGFYALEYLLYDPSLRDQPGTAFTCQLIQALSQDIASTAAAINRDWVESYAEQMRSATARYTDKTEVKQELYKSLNTGLQMLADMRLGRPLGSFDAPRPKRAEAWRSGRSQHHIVLALQSLHPLASALADGEQPLTGRIDAAFLKPISRGRRLDDPRLEGVSDPAKRFRIEALQQEVNDLRSLIEHELGPSLGVLAGFNSLDGD